MDDPLSQELFSSSGKDRSAREELLLKCRDTISQLQEELEQERGLKQEAETLNGQLQSDVLELQDQLHALKVKDYSRVLEEEHNDQAFGSTKKKLSACKEELARSVQERQLFKAQNDDLRQELQKAQQLLSEARQELSKNKGVVSEWSESISSVEAKLRTLTRENLGLKEENRALMQATEEMKETVQDVYRKTQSESKALEDKLQAARSQLRAEEDTRKLAQQKYMEGYSQQASQYQETLAEARTTLAATQKDLEDTRQESALLRDRVREHQDQADSDKARFTSLESERIRLSSELAEVKSTLGKQIGSAQVQEAETQQSIKLLKGQLDSAVSDSRNLRDQLNACQDRLEAAVRKSGQYEQSIERLKNELGLANEEKETHGQQVLRQRAEFQDQLRVVKEQHRKDLQNLLEENRTKLESALNDYQLELEQELARREEEQEAFGKETQSLKDSYQKLLLEKEEDVSKLNQDRERLREAIMELESKLMLISHTFEDRTNLEQRKERKAKSRLVKDNESLKDQVQTLQAQLVHESELFKTESRRKDEELVQLKRQSEDRIARRTAAITEQADLKVLEMKEKCLKELAYLSKLMTSVELEGRGNSSTGRIGEYLKAIIDRLEQMVDNKS